MENNNHNVAVSLADGHLSNANASLRSVLDALSSATATDQGFVNEAVADLWGDKTDTTIELVDAIKELVATAATTSSSTAPRA